MVGMRGIGEMLKSVLKKPWTAGKLLHLRAPLIPTPHALLAIPAKEIGSQIRKFANVCQTALIWYREGILDREFIQSLLGDIATELFTASCVYARLAALSDHPTLSAADRDREWSTGLYYIKIATRRNCQRFQDLKANVDLATNSLADALLGPAHP